MTIRMHVWFPVTNSATPQCNLLGTPSNWSHTQTHRWGVGPPTPPSPTPAPHPGCHLGSERPATDRTFPRPLPGLDEVTGVAHRTQGDGLLPSSSVCYKRVNSGTDRRAALSGVWGGDAGLLRPPGPAVPTSPPAHQCGGLSRPCPFGFLGDFVTWA